MTAANVNPATGLATDYLNVFNEALMLVDMAPDFPDVLEDLADWEPVDYRTHFKNSAFSFKDVVIAAYDQADPGLRESFDTFAKELANHITTAIIELQSLADTGKDVSGPARALSNQLKSGVSQLDSMIHGRSTQDAVDQDAVDALFD